MTTIWEETKTQGAKMKGRPLKEKLDYFWEYYKIHTIVAATVIALIASLVHAWVTSKDMALGVVISNSMAGAMEGVTDKWIQDLSELIDFDPKKYEVSIDTSIMLGSASNSADQDYANMQKMAAMFSASSIDILTADSEIFERYAQNEYLHDLRDLYSDEELRKFEGHIYYTDASTFSDYEDTETDVMAKQAAYVIDHRDPSSMKEPVPVGIYADESTLIGQSQIYFNLDSLEPYQGHPSEAIIGIAVNTPRAEAAKTGLEYLSGK